MNFTELIDKKNNITQIDFELLQNLIKHDFIKCLTNILKELNDNNEITLKYIKINNKNEFEFEFQFYNDNNKDIYYSFIFSEKAINNHYIFIKELKKSDFFKNNFWINNKWKNDLNYNNCLQIIYKNIHTPFYQMKYDILKIEKNIKLMKNYLRKNEKNKYQYLNKSQIQSDLYQLKKELTNLLILYTAYKKNKNHNILECFDTIENNNKTEYTYISKNLRFHTKKKENKYHGLSYIELKPIILNYKLLSTKE